MGNGMKSVMFGDDESRILDGVHRMLCAERKPWDMGFALGGEAALKAFETRDFDIIVCDMCTPGMDGATLLTGVRELSPIPGRIILSGHTDLEAAMPAISVAHRFLAKPGNASTLREAIERAGNLQDVLSSPDIHRVLAASRIAFLAIANGRHGSKPLPIPE
jgi:DNA-binding NtrC family response regulator